MEVSAETGAAVRLGYRAELDGLRGVAVVLVVVGHSMLERVPHFAAYAVEIFFVLSGFLITSLLVEEREGTGTVRLGAFYLRRARRLLPALALLLLVVGGWAALVGDESAQRGVLGGASYSSNWLRVAEWDIAPLEHLWSLAVEEHFYIVWPLAVAAIGSARGVVRVAALGAVASVLWRWHLIDEGAGHLRLNNGTDTRASALLIGAALAAGHHLGWRADTKRIGAALILGVIVLQPGKHQWGYLLCSVGVALLILGAVTVGDRVLRWAPLAWLGGISYALYLWHVVIMEWVAYSAPVFTVALSVLVAWASTRYVEARWRARQHPRQSPPEPTPGCVPPRTQPRTLLSTR